MSDQDAGDEASRDQIADLEDFEAKFKPEDFAGVAQAFGCLKSRKSFHGSAGYSCRSSFPSSRPAQGRRYHAKSGLPGWRSCAT